MCLSDTAEYWNDIKSSSNRYHPTHASVARCHLSNGTVSNNPDDVDCWYCKKLMTDEVKAEMLKKHENNLRNRARSEKHKQEKKAKKLGQGICTCGKAMIKRQNSKDKTYFKGCTNYPICKHTEPIKN